MGNTRWFEAKWSFNVTPLLNLFVNSKSKQPKLFYCFNWPRLFIAKVCHKPMVLLTPSHGQSQHTPTKLFCGLIGQCHVSPLFQICEN